jgi:hypothetical protein
MYILDWQNFDIGLAAILFLAYVFADGLYAYYTISVSRQRAVRAATSSAFIHILLAFGVLSYVQNFLYVIPIAIGSWVGIYLVVSHDLKVGSEKMLS